MEMNTILLIAIMLVILVVLIALFVRFFQQYKKRVISRSRLLINWFLVYMVALLAIVFTVLINNVVI
ncbi:hypothetical protein [Kurthia sibirica]|uniref:Uncharacterized protein n=1 Tax=Kurthia sibirica TaxID=202750 RepID=A0A2U3APK4_9BACL|nr:hypothetical protein [Kurthia sibirica]PWI26473.1 hypothetical protein DEX24_03850 [Kurthia sibirica]GEK33042.1 hypothetical protein KSI01_05750 [Kurthia sibirica]